MASCPMDFQATFVDSEQQMTLQHVQQIEEHVAASNKDCPHPPLKDIVLNDPIKGSSPLLMACYYGEIASVKRIVELWGADVNLAATFYFDPFNDDLKIEKVSPLFVAASIGHLEIVRYLVDYGANVFSKTSNEANPKYDGLSTLYGAVSNYSRLKSLARERSAVVRLLLKFGADPSADTIRPFDGNPMWTSSLCGIEAITALIEHGMNVNHRSSNLDEITLLNYSVVKKSSAIVELLMSKGADLHIEDRWGLTPIIRAAYYLRWEVLEFLLERNELSRVEKIEALELAGAVTICIYGQYGNESRTFSKAIGYWRKSLQLRSMIDADGCGPIMKTSPKNPEMGSLIEWMTYEDLEDVIQHRYKQEIQSFLVLSRILKVKSWQALKFFYEEYIFKRLNASQLVKQDRFADVLSILWFVLETIRDDFDALEKDLWFTTLTVVEHLSVTLSVQMERGDPLLNENTIKKSLELIFATDQFHLYVRETIANYKLGMHMNLMFKLIVMLAELPHLMNKYSMESLTELVQRDQRRSPNDAGKSLLHMACGNHSNIQHLTVPTVELLLRAGADPNAGYNNDNGVFHAMVIASLECNIDASIQASVARLLLDAGAHLDRVNAENKTASDLWMNPGILRKKRRWYEQQIIPKSDLPSWLRADDPVPKLKCECARVIRSYGVPYKYLLPSSLFPFVSWH